MEVIEYFLQDAAADWWEAVMRNQVGGSQLRWSEFTEEFHNQYCPDTYQTQKRLEFDNLIQGSRSVAEYEATFTSLSRLYPEICGNERLRCERFFRGRREDIRDYLPLMKSFTDLLATARQMELSRSLRRKTQVEEPWKKPRLDARFQRGPSRRYPKSFNRGSRVAGPSQSFGDRGMQRTVGAGDE